MPKKPDCYNRAFLMFISTIYYCLSSSKILFGRIFSLIAKVIQNGKMNPKRNKSIQNATPPNTKNKTIPKMLIIALFEL